VHPLIHGPLYACHDGAHHPLAVGAQHFGDIEGGRRGHATVLTGTSSARTSGDAGTVRAMAVGVSGTLARKVTSGGDPALEIGMIGVDPCICDSDAHPFAHKPLVPQARRADLRGGGIQKGVDGQVLVDAHYVRVGR